MAQASGISGRAFSSFECSHGGNILFIPPPHGLKGRGEEGSREIGPSAGPEWYDY